MADRPLWERDMRWQWNVGKLVLYAGAVFFGLLVLVLILSLTAGPTEAPMNG